MAAFSHQNLIKIIDAGMLDPSTKHHPYTVLEYNPGLTLQAILDPKQNPLFEDIQERAVQDPSFVIELLRQICWPLAYLHNRRFFHMDVAPKNIFVQSDRDNLYVVLGDVGAGQTVPALDALTREQAQEQVHIVGTRAYTPPELNDYVNRKPIEIELLAKFVPFWDIYALGVVINDILKGWNLRNERGYATLGILAERLKQRGNFRHVEEVDEELRRLLPSQLITAGVPELSQHPHGSHIGSIPIPLGPVPYTKRILDIIDHPVYARLRRIPQLMLVHAVHPGGVHTRFEHALGTYDLGRRYLVRLLSDSEFRVEFRRSQLEEALLAVLLCSISAFPLDHAVFEVLSREKSYEIRKEVRTRELFDMEVFPLPSAEGSLRALINDRFPSVDVDRLIQIIGMDSHLDDYPATIIESIIKSSVNVRIVDYLRRDSLHTSIPAGQGIDVDDLIANIVPVHYYGRVGISQQGILAVENLAYARYWMFNRVYWNTLNRSLTSMLNYTIYALLEIGGLSPLEFVSRMRFSNEASALKELSQLWDDYANEQYRQHSVLHLLRRARPLPYELLLEATRDSRYGRVVYHIDNLQSYSELELFRLQLIDGCSRVLQRKLNIADLLIDLPKEKALKLGEDIDVLKEDGEIQRLRESSRIIDSLPTAFSMTAQKLRIFLSPELKDLRSREDLPNVVGEQLMRLAR